MNKLMNLFVIIGSITSIGFGLWHFFVPRLWNWYSYIDINAKELILAIRAINVFFSLSLILFGIINLLFIYGNKSNSYSITVMLSATCVLWFMRVVFQIVYPQGMINPFLQYGMLLAFILIFLCYFVSLYIMIAK